MDVKYITPSLTALIWSKHPRPNSQWDSSDYKAYKELVAQTKVKSFPNRTGTVRPRATWKWKYILRKTTVPRESIAEEESEYTDDTVSLSDTASIGDTESSEASPSPSLPVSTRKYRSVPPDIP